VTREETIKILAILKAAYPNSYRNMSKEEANGTVAIWTMQFAQFPAELVMLAVNKLISSSPFPPAIWEVKDKIRGMYWEVWGILAEDNQYNKLTTDQRATYQRILDAIEPLRSTERPEPSIIELMGGNNKKLLGG
jgi:hypothetical protein